MSLDLEALRAGVAAQGRVARVVIAGAKGSTPREVGAAMLVWRDGQAGTIGGGTLEHEAILRARAALAARAVGGEGQGNGGGNWLQDVALGPDLGQCCGGRVTLLCEVYDAARMGEIGGPIHARHVPGTTDRNPSLRVQRALALARNGVGPLAPALIDGWMIEPVSPPARPLWIFGAGHVGRALVRVLAPLPQFRITWIDTARTRFPEDIDAAVSPALAQNPADLVAHAPQDAAHLVLTYSHALDLELCHRLLDHGFARAGLIGSASKWARFRKRLAALGHAPEAIARIDCPIGTPGLGKHPQAIAIGVAGALLQDMRPNAQRGDAARTGMGK